METRENIRSIYPVAAGTAAGQAEEPEKQESVRESRETGRSA